MRNLKNLVLVGGAAAIVALTGCEMIENHNKTSDRSAGRELDDKVITETVKKDLNQEPVYKFGDVDVKTFGGVVQLSGFVNTDEQKQRAAQIAQHVDGVSQVVNNISLKPVAQGRTSYSNTNNLAPTGR
jgi:osmotically-inducible protein OsmY